jgi:hypothetical protein
MIKLNRHPDRLVPSQPDDIELLIAVVDRYNGLLEHYLRIRGVELVIPDEIERCRKLIIRVKERYQRNDFRRSESEKLALREFAQWTLLINSELRNQEPVILKWKD